MKKKLFNIIILCCLLLQGCVDFSSGKRPVDYINTKWTSEDPNIYFEVKEEFREIYGTVTYGKISTYNETIEIYVDFDYGKGIFIKKLESDNSFVDVDQILRGICHFGENKLIVKVIEKDEEWFDEDLEEITFVREDL